MKAMTGCPYTLPDLGPTPLKETPARRPPRHDPT